VVIATHPHSSNLVPMMDNLGFNVPRKWEVIKRTHEQKQEKPCICGKDLQIQESVNWYRIYCKAHDLTSFSSASSSSLLFVKSRMSMASACQCSPTHNVSTSCPREGTAS
jgi:hypothetical protein